MRSPLIVGKVYRSLFFPGRLFSTGVKKRKVCIVGSGPAGFYTAQRILSKSGNIDVDIYEKLPVPFGLIRYGVAPDHDDVKHVSVKFTEVGLDKRCRFYGNVAVGKDVTVPELLKAYDAVVLAYGANKNRILGIPGENSKNVFSASEIVGWYTGQPEQADLDVDLNVDVAAVIGNGNVALDVSRILLRDIEKLKATDIASNAYKSLKQSRLQRVVLIGRRGPLQANFTAKEIREIKTLPEFKKIVHTSDFKGLSELLPSLPRFKTRIVKVTMTADEHQVDSSKELEIKFFRSPKQIIPNPDGKVSKMILTVNKLKGRPDLGEVIGTEEEEILNCGLVVKCIGFQCTVIDPSVPFDEKKKIIPNVLGKVIGVPGLYCSGWVKSGPVGSLSTTMPDSQETAHQILLDLKAENNNGIKDGHEEIKMLLNERGIKTTNFDDWQKIDAIEQERGKAVGKEKEKIYRINEMLQLAGLQS